MSYERIWQRIKTLALDVADGSLSEPYIETALRNAIAAETFERVPEEAMHFYAREIRRLADSKKQLGFLSVVT